MYRCCLGSRAEMAATWASWAERSLKWNRTTRGGPKTIAKERTKLPPQTRSIARSSSTARPCPRDSLTGPLLEFVAWVVVEPPVALYCDRVQRRACSLFTRPRLTTNLGRRCSGAHWCETL